MLKQNLPVETRFNNSLIFHFIILLQCAEMNRVDDSLCLFYNWLDLVVIRIGTSNFWSYSINLQSACVLVIQEEQGKAVHMCKEVPAMAPSFQCVLGKNNQYLQYKLNLSAHIHRQTFLCLLGRR